MSETLEFNDGKDLVIFATKQDHSKRSSIELPVLEPAPGVILPNGDINWLCPCLGGLATGPCGIPFRQAFTCFHLSQADPKGSDCVEAFKEMQDCMLKHPKIYRNDSIPVSMDNNNDDDDVEIRPCGPTKEAGSSEELKK